MKYFDASVSALRFSLPSRERGVVDFARNTVYENSFDEQNSFALMANSDRALRCFESWALGKIPAREFRTYNRFSSGTTLPPGFRELWVGLAQRMKEGYDREGGPAGYAKYQKTPTYRVIRRRARIHYRIGSSAGNFAIHQKRRGTGKRGRL
jgi:hypothetical protein